MMSEPVRANGVLMTGLAVLYTPSAGRVGRIRLIEVVNSDVAVRTFNIWLRVGASGTARRIMSKDCELEARFTVENDLEYVLKPGDAILGSADAASVLEWTICGEEE